MCIAYKGDIFYAGDDDVENSHRDQLSRLVFDRAINSEGNLEHIKSWTFHTQRTIYSDEKLISNQSLYRSANTIKKKFFN